LCVALDKNTIIYYNALTNKIGFKYSILCQKEHTNQKREKELNVMVLELE